VRDDSVGVGGAVLVTDLRGRPAGGRVSSPDEHVELTVSGAAARCSAACSTSTTGPREPLMNPQVRGCCGILKRYRTDQRVPAGGMKITSKPKTLQVKARDTL